MQEKLSFLTGINIRQDDNMQNFYQLRATDIHGKKFDFSQLKGNVVLVVNTASHCGFTPQFAGLEKLYQTYQSAGLVIIGFPCNQFGRQEPADEPQISEFCALNYGVTFPMMAKIEVNGDNSHPVYQFLKAQPQGKGMLGDTIKWNFTKFLVNQTGDVVARYAPTKAPTALEADIQQLLTR